MSLQSAHEGLIRRGVTNGRRKTMRARPWAESLEDRKVPAPLVVGSAPGAPAQVKILDETGALTRTIDAFPRPYRGGVAVTTGNVNSDNIPDVIAAMERGRGTVRVFDGRTGDVLGQFVPFGRGHRGGATVAFGQLEDNATPSIIVGTATGRAVVRTFDAVSYAPGLTLRPFGPGVRGVTVAASHLRNTIASELVVAPAAGGPAKILFFDGTGKQIGSLQDDQWRRDRRGILLTTGDFDNNGLPDLASAVVRRGDSALVQVWTSRPDNPLVSQFVASPSGVGSGIELGSVAGQGNTGDRIALTHERLRPGRESAVAGRVAAPQQESGRPIDLVDLNGNLESTVFAAGVGDGAVSLAEAAPQVFHVYAGTKYRGVGYNPTWPSWGSRQYPVNFDPANALHPTGGSSTTLTDAGQQWIPDQFKGNTVYVFKTSAGAGAGRNFDVIGNTANTLTVRGGFGFTPDNTYTYSINSIQLHDSDFFNTAFQALWGTYSGTLVDDDGTTVQVQNQGRQDLQTIHSYDFNLVRLYNWGPSRSSSNSGGLSLDTHRAFLAEADRQNLGVIVPVSNYFLGDDQFAWNGQNPDENYSFDKAPQAIRTALDQFLASIRTPNGNRISKAVRLISIGNEIDLDISADPGPTAKLQRTLWWIVNLQARLDPAANPALYEQAQLHPQFTIPISTADQDWAAFSGNTGPGSTATTLQSDPNSHPAWPINRFQGVRIRLNGPTYQADPFRTVTGSDGFSLTLDRPVDPVPGAGASFSILNPNPLSWFQIFSDGATAQDYLPSNTKPAQPLDRFTANVRGLSDVGAGWYADWLVNSVNTFRFGPDLTRMMNQYDYTNMPPKDPSQDWGPQWPGKKLPVPFMFTEFGYNRMQTGTYNPADQFQTLTTQQVQVAEDHWNAPSSFMGYSIFEFNDEPNKNNINPAQPDTETTYGLFVYNTDPANFRRGTTLLSKKYARTSQQYYAGGTLFDYNYPVYQLFPVTDPASGESIVDRLKRIFGQSSSKTAPAS
ncbi:MAG: hypothetical protein U0790_21985 [Isosphaeraceae bacterium]